MSETLDTDNDQEADTVTAETRSPKALQYQAKLIPEGRVLVKALNRVAEQLDPFHDG